MTFAFLSCFRWNQYTILIILYYFYWLTCQKKPVRMLLFPTSLYTTCLEYCTVVLWYISFVSSSVCRYHCFHAITFVQDKLPKGQQAVQYRSIESAMTKRKKRTNHNLQSTTQKTIYWETRTPLQTRFAPLVAPVVLLVLQIMVIRHESGKDWIVITSKGTYPLSSATYTFSNGYQSHDGDGKTFRSDIFIFVILLSSFGLPFSIFNFF